MNTYYKILNEIASVFDMDQWDEQVNLFVDVINEQLSTFVHNTKYNHIYILEACSSNHDFPQYNFYKERCYVNGEKVKLDKYGTVENKWFDKRTVNVIIKDLDQLGESCKGMFYWCESLVSVPQFDTSMVTDMRGMFFECESLVSVPKFDTGRVIDMMAMFCTCLSLGSVPLFNISRVTDMNYMFQRCYSLSKETIQEWSSVYNFEIDRMK